MSYLQLTCAAEFPNAQKANAQRFHRAGSSPDVYAVMTYARSLINKNPDRALNSIG